MSLSETSPFLLLLYPAPTALDTPKNPDVRFQTFPNTVWGTFLTTQVPVTIKREVTRRRCRGPNTREDGRW